MSSKFKRTSAAAIALASACAMLFVGSALVHAQQFQVLGASPATQESAPEVAISRQLILHNITLSGTAVDPDSRPVLDYAIQLLRQYPATRVYVSGRGDRGTVQREAQAVAQYLKHRGIRADRVIVQDTTAPRPLASHGSSAAAVIVLNLMASDCDTCSS